MMSVGKQRSNLDVRNENLSEIVHKLQKMILNLWRKNIRELWIKVSVNIEKKIRNKIDNLKSTNRKEYWKNLKDQQFI